MSAVMLDALPELLTRHRHAALIAFGATAVAGGLFALSVARLIWVIADAATPVSTAAAVIGKPLTAAAPQPGALSRWHLFGNAALVTDSRALASAAPDTSLALKLRGIFASDDPKSGYAIIADGNGSDQVYRVGMQVSGGAQVDSVYPDRVMLNRAGVLEALRLPEDKRGVAASALSPQPDRAASGGRGQPINGAMLTPNSAPQSQAPAFVNPNILVGSPTIDGNKAGGIDLTQLARQVSVMPVLENGKFVGVRLSGGRDQALIAKLGLRPDDVVTSINGIPLDSPNRATEVAKSLETARSAAVTVRRNGKDEKLTVTL